jgi:hypothetical protein
MLEALGISACIARALQPTMARTGKRGLKQKRSVPIKVFEEQSFSATAQSVPFTLLSHGMAGCLYNDSSGFNLAVGLH